MSTNRSAFDKSHQIKTVSRFDRNQSTFRENQSPNASGKIFTKKVDINKESSKSVSDVAKIQEQHIQTLKERFTQLRAANTHARSEARMKIIDLQKKIAQAQNRQKILMAQIKEYDTECSNEAKEELAAKVIEDIWNELNKFRNEIREKQNFDEKLQSIAENDIIEDIQNEPLDVSDMVPSIDDCLVPMTPIVNSPQIDSTLSSSKSKSNVSTPIVIDDDNDGGMDPYSTCKSKTIEDTPAVKVPGKRVRGKKCTIIDSPADSIASRRTPRRGKEVYYKEPSLREALSPNSPFAFSLGEERSTPTIPPGYSRDTPSISKKKRY